jgi:hypothetical protein
MKTGALVNMSISPGPATHAVNCLRELCRKILARNRAESLRQCAYPAECLGKATVPLIEQLEPRLMLTGITALSVTEADLTEGVEQTLTATAEMVGFDRWEVRWGVGETREYDLNSGNVTSAVDSVTVTDTFAYGDNGTYGITATAIYQGDTESLRPKGKVYHGEFGNGTVGYLMYSETSFADRKIHGPGSAAWIKRKNADPHLTMVKYYRGWMYYTGSEWRFFTPESGDLLLARFNHYDGEVVDYLDQTAIEADNMELGYADGSLSYTTHALKQFTTFKFADNRFARNGATFTVNERVDILNVVPAIDRIATTVTVAPEGNTVYLDLNFTDAGIEDRHTVSVDWGDALGDSGVPAWTQISQDSMTDLWLDTNVGSLELAHRYSAAGAYDIEVTVTDDDSGASTSYTIEDVVVFASTVSPASSVTGALNGSALTVLGTNGNDDILLSRMGTVTTLYVNGTNVNSWSGVTEAVIYGFDGDDAIITASVMNPVVYGGDGDDTLAHYMSLGDWEMHGGAGDDVLMEDALSHAGSTAIRGDAGLDRFFVSDTSLVNDPSIQEVAEEQLFKTTRIVDALSYAREGDDGWTSGFNRAISAARGTDTMADDEWVVVYVPPGTYEFGVSDCTDANFDVREPLVGVMDHVAVVGAGSHTVLTYTDELRADWRRSLLGARAESGQNYGVFNLEMDGKTLQTEMLNGFNQYVNGLFWSNSDQLGDGETLAYMRNLRMEKLKLENFPGAGIAVHHGLEHVRIRDVEYSDCHYTGVTFGGGRVNDVVVERTEQFQGDDPTPRWGVNIEIAATQHDPDVDRINNFVLRDSVLLGDLYFDGMPDRGEVVNIENVRILDNEISGLVRIHKAKDVEIRGNVVSSDDMAPNASGLVYGRRNTYDTWQNLIRISYTVDNADIRGNTVIALNGAFGGIAVAPNEFAMTARDVVIANNTVITPNFGIIVKGGDDSTGNNPAADSQVRNVTVTGNSVQRDPDTSNSGVSLTSVSQSYEVGNISTTVDTGPWVSTIFFVEDSGIDHYGDVAGPRRNNIVDKMVIHFNEVVTAPTTWSDAVRIYNHKTQEYLNLPAPDTKGYGELGGYEVSRTSDPSFSDIGSVWTFTWDDPWDAGVYTVELVASEILSDVDSKALDGDVDWSVGGNYVHELLIAVPGDANFDGIVDQIDVDLVNLMRESQQGPTIVDIGIDDFVVDFDMPYPHHAHLRLGENDSFDTTGSFSLAFKANEFDQSGTYKFFKKYTAPDTGEVSGWWLQGDTFTITDGAKTYSVAMGQSGTSWAHMAIVVDAGDAGADGEIRIYKDGNATPVETQTIDAGFDYTKAGATGTGLLIGGSATNSVLYGYNGQMDDVCVATRVLSTAEITALASGNTTPTVNGGETIGHWTFENNWDDSGVDGVGANPWGGRRDWAVGDFDNDNDVDQHDLAIVANNLGESAVGSASVDALSTTDTTPVLTGSLNTDCDNIWVFVTVDDVDGPQSLPTHLGPDGTWSTFTAFARPLRVGAHDVTVQVHYLTTIGHFTATKTYSDALTIESLDGIVG